MSRSRSCYLATAHHASALPCNMNEPEAVLHCMEGQPLIAGHSAERSQREGVQEYRLTYIIIDHHAIVTISVPCKGREPAQLWPPPFQLAVAHESSQGLMTAALATEGLSSAQASYSYEHSAASGSTGSKR